MSLFKARPFWSVLCDVDEKFDQSSLEVSKINSEADKIIIGSHNGILRIYEPSSELKEDNVLKDFQPSDLLIEKIFPHPILQISTGRLVSGSTKIHIAVLYPRSVSVYGLTTREGATDHGTQNMLSTVYEHKLRRCAANFCIGPFGGLQTRDFICIQSLDGLLIFYEQESFAFCCFLPQFLLPGPLIYVKKTDGFVTMSSTWHVSSFSYKSLSEAGQNSGEDDSTGAKITSTWSYNIGEELIEIQYIPDLNGDGYIIALGEKNLYCLTENGIMRFVKRLGYTPICLHAYSMETENTVWTLIVAETNTLLIYMNTTLKWSAQLPFLPISIRRASFKNVDGVLVLLSEDGTLNCSYLGTEPHLFSTPPLANQEIDYEKAEAELESLTKIIRNYYSSDTKLTNTTPDKEIQMEITVSPELDNDIYDLYPSCTILINIIPNVIIEEVQVTIVLQKPLKCSNEIGFYKTLREKITFESKVYISEPSQCLSTEAEVIISMVTNLGVPKVIKTVIALPLQLFLNNCDDTKANKYKVIFELNQEAPSLSQLFPEFLQAQPSTTNEIRLKMINGDDSAVIITKHSNKYRIQSDSILLLNIMVRNLIIRVRKQFATENNFVMSYKGKLPISDFLTHVKEHFGKIQIVNQSQTNLNHLCGQFRVIQKRLISKFKDKNPTPLSNMEKLLEQTYLEIIRVGTQLELQLAKLANIQVQLSSVLQLLLSLMSLMHVNKNLMPMLETTFCPFVCDIEGQNWEDVVETSMCYLLQTVLSRTEGEKIKLTTFEEVRNIAKLELHITQVLDRMQSPNAIPEVQIEEEPSSDKNDKDLLPIGSRLAESSFRVASARRRGLSSATT